MTTGQPLVHLFCFGRRQGAEPTIFRDWSAAFNDGQGGRRVPAPAVWEKELLPQLEQVAREEVADKLDATGLVYLRGENTALSAGFAFGHTFRAANRYRLGVEQSRAEPPSYWLSEAEAPAHSLQPKFAPWTLPGDPTKSEGVLIIKALPDRGDQSIVHEVGAYLGETEAFQQIKTITYNLPDIQRLLKESFSLSELVDIVFINPVLKDVYDRVSEAPGKDHVIRYILDYVERRNLFEPFFEIIAAANPIPFEQSAAKLKTTPASSQKFGGLLLLEAEQINNAEGWLTGWEAALLARQSKELVRAFRVQHGLTRLKLFLAVPLGLAVFLAHHWNALGVEIELYEWAGVSGEYLPACTVRV